MSKKNDPFIFHKHIRSKILSFMILTHFKYENTIAIVNDKEALSLFNKIVFDDAFHKFSDIKSRFTFENIKNINLLNNIKNYYNSLYYDYSLNYGSLIKNKEEYNNWLDEIVKTTISDLERQKLMIHKTPLKLVNEILDQLPQQIWKDHTKTWFDPCCGTGEFIVQVARRLLKNLPQPYNNLKHIIENMLYFNDINPNMIEITKYRLDFELRYNYNSYCNNFIEVDLMGKKFDVILGNPPYQEDKSNNKLYPKFYKKSLDILNDDGYLCMITPVAIIKAFTGGQNANQHFDRLENKSIRFINFNINHYFDVGVKVCFFLLRNSAQFNNIVPAILESGDQIDVDLENTIPLNNRSNLEEIIFNKIFSSSSNQFKLSHAVAGKRFELDEGGPYMGIENINSKGELIYRFGNKVKDWCFFDHKKIIVRIFGEQIVYDVEGKMISIKNNVMSCLVSDDEILLLKSLFNSNIYKFYLIMTNEKRSPYVSFISNIRKIDKKYTGNVYEYFGLTEEEIDYIEKEIK